MEPLRVVIAQSNPKAAEVLAASLKKHLGPVSVASSMEELRTAIPQRRAGLAVVDLEMVPLPQVKQICREFGNVSVVCTHRLPDEEMWTSALEAGAIDCCENEDIRGIVEAARRNVTAFHAA